MELTLVHLNVDRTPPDLILGGVLVHDPLGLRAAAGLLAGEANQSTGRGDDRALVLDGVLVQDGRGRVALDLDAVHVKAGLREVLQVAANDCRSDTDVNKRVLARWMDNKLTI